MGPEQPIHRVETRARFGPSVADGEVVDICAAYQLDST